MSRPAGDHLQNNPPPLTSNQNQYYHSTALKLSDRWLELDFPFPHAVLSWAIIGGGWQTTEKFIWHRVHNQELTPEIDPKTFFSKRIADEHKGRDQDIVGLLTSACLFDYTDTFHCFQDHWVRCVATVGMGNAVQVGCPPTQWEQYGTINIFLQSSASLNLLSSMEAASLVAEARTLAVLQAEIPCSQGSRHHQHTHHLATGTGTDCIAIASPLGGSPLAYSGKHTPIGHLIGAATYEAVKKGLDKWKKSKKK